MPYECVVHGRRYRILEHDGLVAVRFRDAVPHRRRQAIAAAAALHRYHDRIELPDEHYVVLPVAPIRAPREDRRAAGLRALARAKGVHRATPVFTAAGSERHAIATDRLIIGVLPGKPEPSARIRRSGWKILAADDGELLVRLKPHQDPLVAAKKVARWPSVRHAEPDFVLLGNCYPAAKGGHRSGGNPRLALGQYAVRITQATRAWKVGAGADGVVRVAVLDGGVDVRHPDLQGAFAAGYDATSGRTDQQPHPWDGHGTECAGIAVGTHASRPGVKGIGAGALLLPVRIGYTPSADGSWVAKHWWVARGIDWAWRNGADVLSCSWSGGPPSPSIAQAFSRARTRGRRGKGCVIVVAAGNTAGPVGFPGTLPGVLTIAASNQFDDPKTPRDRTGDSTWGSCFGPEVDLAAPGVAIYTTAIPRRGAGLYLANFDGTSAATPIVAGAAARVLAVNPSLSGRAVGRVLCQTADRVGGVVYHLGRNDHMGHGRLNVYRALMRALALGAGRRLGRSLHSLVPKRRPA